MSRSTEGKKAVLASGSTVRNPAFGAVRSRRGGRSPKSTIPYSATGRTDRADAAVLTHRRRGLGGAIGPDQLVTESVESLAKYRPGSRKYEVSLTFSGEAGNAMSQLMTDLGVNSANEVVKLTIALLVSARGKEILLRDPVTGVMEMVEL